MIKITTSQIKSLRRKVDCTRANVTKYQWPCNCAQFWVWSIEESPNSAIDPDPWPGDLLKSIDLWEVLCSITGNDRAYTEGNCENLMLEFEGLQQQGWIISEQGEVYWTNCYKTVKDPSEIRVQDGVIENYQRKLIDEWKPQLGIALSMTRDYEEDWLDLRKRAEQDKRP